MSLNRVVLDRILKFQRNIKFMLYVIKLPYNSEKKKYVLVMSTIRNSNHLEKPEYIYFFLAFS